MDIARKRSGTEWRWLRKYYGAKKLFTGKMNLELKKRIMKCLVWNVETWTLTQTDRRSEAFEKWIWRRMEKISWLDKVTNEEVLRRVNEDRQILNYFCKGNIDELAMF